MRDFGSETPGREPLGDPDGQGDGARPPYEVSSRARILVSGEDVLRRAERQDAAAFGALQRAAYAQNRDILGVEPIPLQTSPAEAIASYEVWLLEDGNGLAGALALAICDDHLLIWSVSVEPTRQNGGVGRRLLAAAEARAGALGLDWIRLYTGEKLRKNVDWYGRHGYGVERIEDMSDRRAVHMIKRVER